MHRFYFLTAPQVQRLHYSTGDLPYAQRRLKRLHDGGWLLRTPFLTASAIGKGSAKGKLPYVYCLTRQAQRYLAELGVDIDQRFEPQEEIRRSNIHLLHTLSVNDFLIAAGLLDRSEEQIQLHEMIPERALKRQVDRVTIPRGDRGTESVAVIPDGWLDFRVTEDEGTLQFGIALELDRGTEEQKAWRRKARSLIAWHQGPFEQHFQILNTQGKMIPSSLYIAVVAIPGQRRLQELLTWTQLELAAMPANERDQAAELFFFTAENPESTSPQSLFLERVWQQPSYPEPVSLLAPN
jgi:hypothetical protein